MTKKNKELKKVATSTDELALVFHRCHNILRDQEGIVGMKALNIVGDLLFLKLLEPLIEKKELKLSDDCRFSTFANMSDEDMMEHIKKVVWKELWAKMPTVYNGRAFEIKYPHTLKDIVLALETVDFDHTSNDIKGAAYEHFISKELIGKTLGQFFTPRNVVNSMVEELNPKVKADGTSETIYDPACGTGGFLVQAFKHLKAQKGANLDWIRKNAIHGGEREPDTVRICKLNMMLAGDGNSTIVNRDSLMYCPEETYDIVLANPPFGIKGIKFEKLGINYPVESNTAEFLFLENIVKVLKRGGRAAVVLPEGVLFKTGVGTKLREWFLKEVKLEKVVSLASGTFDYAGVKTAILYFTKPEKSVEEGKFATDKVEFSVFGEKEKTKISIKELIKKNFILIAKQYQQNQEVKKEKAEGFWNLSDVVDIEFGTRIVKKNSKRGEYPVYGGGDASFDTDQYNRDGETIVVARFALSKECVRLVKGKFFLNDSGMSVKSKNEEIMRTKYLGYWLLQNQDKVYDTSRGAAQRNVDQELFAEIKIPKMDLVDQNSYIEKMDFIYEQLNKSKVVVVENIQKEMEITLKDSISKNKQDVKHFKLKDLCKYQNGGALSGTETQPGLKIVRIQNLTNLEKQFNYIKESEVDPKYIINNGDFLFAWSGTIDFFEWHRGKAALNQHIFKLYSFTENEVIPKYLFYFLKYHVEQIRELAHGATMKHITKGNVDEIDVFLPSKPEQEKTLKLLEKKAKIIELIEQDLMDKE